MTAHPLTYDNLPSHSRLQRELVDGVLKIIASPEEPGPLVRRSTLLRAAVPASLICFCTLVVGLAIFGATYEEHRRYMSAALSATLFIAFVVFCAALFALIWRIQFAARIEAAQQALQQTTILAASKGRLIIETSGPLGAASHDLKSEPAGAHIAAICIGRSVHQHVIGTLEILLKDGTRICILPGRDELELRWVAKALRAALQL